ncbi:heat-inducible transcriptional repressor HrcA [Ectothiorhodospira shaposhnikovii]|uniref:heat-inducible transcriptional repressor HrcA n=1 Tax=Ectothiorhodospira shaposhnikovii TaxID=1054 RepID=UPI001EE900A5|nr:heat-inducible transcriptional repressor HrcA [Ectothiorhodospira shaposhnikovii]MCG5511765.1 heat-inducible transcriptional repressor HrcA [Ectothiorhodospira shaposhnikovii]
MKTSPTTQSQALSERARLLLRALVESYVRDGQPVGSRTLARTAGLDLSPASIRNVMADLEDLGLVSSPHTSAGRIPTSLGYRLFVDCLLEVKPLDSAEVRALKQRLTPDMDTKALVESASDLLSAITQMAGMVRVPRRDHAALSQIEFLKLSGRQVLAILVMNKREVQNRILELEREYSHAELQQMANYLNQHLAGRDLRQAREQVLKEMKAVREHMNTLMLAAIELGEKAFCDDEGGDDLVFAGQIHLMDYAELSSVEKLRNLFEAFNEKRQLLTLLDSCISAEGVQIFIGQESGHQVLDDCSVVTAPYSVGGRIVGVLGVIGPTRMAYERIIPAVDITARLLGAALNSRN